MLPPLNQLADGEGTLAAVRDVDVPDMIGRHPVDTDVAAIAHYLTGRRVLVTGAGGSIGSELPADPPVGAQPVRTRRHRPGYGWAAPARSGLGRDRHRGPVRPGPAGRWAAEDTASWEPYREHFDQ
ncbi:MAG TPA: hypothetical protein VLJ59_03875 [Mycobacteriales bacterium]|nr:hypothetical protein [Mycobacteriales bacterium]